MVSALLLGVLDTLLIGLGDVGDETLTYLSIDGKKLF